MSKDEMAFHIFLKRLPTEPLTDSNRRWVQSKAEEAYELAETFIKAKPNKPMFVEKPAKGITLVKLGDES